MPQPVRVLILEDNPADAELTVRELRRAGLEPEWCRVETEPEYRSALEPPPDIILADYSLPQFDGLRALQLLRGLGLEIPFILVSGTVGEEFAVEAMKQGAADYLLKDRLTRLGPAVLHALEQRRLRAEKRLADRRLREGERRFRALIEQSSDAIALLAADGTVLYTSPATARILGGTAEEWMGGNFMTRIAPDALESTSRLFGELLQEPGARRTAQVRYLHKDGSWLWIEAVATNLLAEPSVEAIVVNYRDISPRKRAEEEIVSLARFPGENPSPVLRISKDGRLLYANPASAPWLTAWGLGAGLPIVEDWQRIVLEVLNSREPIEMEYACGGNIYAVRFSPFAESGYVNVYGLDITKRKESEEALAESERHYRQIVETAQEGVWVIDVDNQTTLANKRLADLLGYTVEEMLGKSAYDFMDEEGKAIAASDLERRRQGINEQLDFKFRRKDGSDLWALMETSPLQDHDQKYIGALAMLTDITERKKAEAEIRRRAQEFAALYETASAVASNLDVASLFETITEKVRMLLAPATVALLLYDGERGDLELVAEHASPLPPGTRIRLGQGVSGYAAKMRQPVIVNDYGEWQARIEPLPGAYLGPAMAVPLQHGGELIGTVLLAEEVGGRQFTEEDARLLSLLAGPAASAVHNARLLAETQARSRQLSLLYDTGLAVNSVLDPREQLQVLVKSAARALHAEHAEFWRVDWTQNLARFELGIGYSGQVLDKISNLTFPLEGELGLEPWVVQHQKSLSLPDVTADPRWISVESAIRSALLVPVTHDTERLGVIEVLGTDTNQFTGDDERLLGMFANQVAIALENARLFQETRRRLDELEGLNQISTALSSVDTLDEILPRLLDETLALCQTGVGQIALYDSSTGELRVAATRGWMERMPATSQLAESIEGRVLTTGQPYVTHEWKCDPRTKESDRPKIPVGWGGAVIPIRTGAETIGVFKIAVELPRIMQPLEIQLLTTVAEMAGNAVRRTQLHYETERQVQQLDALHTIDRTITSGVDLKFNLDVILEQVVLALGVDAADVLLLDAGTHTLKHAAGRGFRTAALQFTRLPLGEGLAGRAALERRVVQVKDWAKDLDGLDRSRLLPNEQFVAYYAAPLLAKGELKGILEVFHRKPLPDDPQWLGFLEKLAVQLAIAVDNAELFSDLQRSNLELALAYDTTLEGWTRALDLRDKETEGHTERVTRMTVRLARAMGVPESQHANIRRGALLHDIGKMGIPDGILLKPGPLSQEEWVIMRKHPEYAYKLLQPISYLHEALDIPYCHHEKWDGTGYPRGLKGEQIPFAARIFAVVDVWDALRSERPYRGALLDDQVGTHIREQSGTHFDPEVALAFLELLAEVK